MGIFRLHTSGFIEKGFYVDSGEGNAADHFEVCTEISTKDPEAGPSAALEMQKY